MKKLLYGLVLLLLFLSFVPTWSPDGNNIVFAADSPPSNIHIEMPPVAGSSVDVPLSSQPIIFVSDQLNNPVSGAMITASRGSGTGTLRGTLTVTSNSTGQATFTDLGYDKSGEIFNIQFSSGALSASSDSLGPLAAGAATQVRVETAANGSGTTAGAQSLITGNTLTVYGITRDQYGNYVGNPTDTTWSLINITGGMTNSDLSATSGASVTLTGHQAGTAVIHASNGSLSAGDSGTITVTGTTVVNHLGITTQPATTLSVDLPFNTMAAVTAYDIGNNPISGANIVADIAPVTGTGALRGTLAVATNASGQATFSNLAYNKTDAFKIRFSSNSSSIVSDQIGPLTAGAVASISVFNVPVAGPSVDATLATQPVILTVDQFSNPVSGAMITASRGSGTGTLRGTLTVTSNSTGQATFTDLGYDKSGEIFNIQFSSGALSASSDSLGPLAAGAATQVRVETAANGSGTTAGAQSLITGNTLTVYGITRDQYGNYVGNPTDTTWSLINITGGMTNSDLSATSGASVTLTGHQAGTAVIHASNGSLSAGDSGTITVTGTTVVNHLGITTQPATTLSVDLPFNTMAAVTAYDIGNNPISGVAITASLGTGSGILRGTLTSVSDASGMAAFANLGYNRSGEVFMIRFSSGNLTANSDSLGPLSAGVATQVRVETAANGSGGVVPSQNLNVGNSLTVYGITRDQYGNYVGNPGNATWSLVNKTGGISDSDLSAPSGASVTLTGHQAGSAVINASDTGLTSVGSGSITVVASVIVNGGGGGGGGGGGSSPPSPVIKQVTVNGFSSTSDLKLDSSGFAQAATQLKIDTENTSVTVDIAKNTQLIDANNKALESISASKSASPRPPPPQSMMVTSFEFGPTGAQFNPSLTLTLKFDPKALSSTVNADKVSLAYWDGTKWVVIESTLNKATYTVTAQISHFSEYALLAELGPASLTPASFSLGSLTVSPKEANIGEEVTIRVLAVNTGGSAGKYTLLLRINDAPVESQELILEAGQTRTVAFKALRDQPGKYDLDINGIIGQFTVKPVPSIAATTPAQTTTDPTKTTQSTTASTTPTSAPGTGTPVPTPGKAASPVSWWVIMVIIIVTTAMPAVMVFYKRKTGK